MNLTTHIKVTFKPYININTGDIMKSMIVVGGKEMKHKYMLLLFITMVFVLAACNKRSYEEDNRIVPTYLGMTASNMLPSLEEAGSGDSSLLSTAVNQDDPFGSFDEGTIEDFIDELYPATISYDIDFYTKTNKYVYISVKLSNPDQFDIYSINLNGKTYRSILFENGSNNENIILKLGTGDLSGIKEIIIYDIKYDGGLVLKDVILEGDQILTLGIERIFLPYVTIQNEAIDTGSISLEINLSDLTNLSTMNKVVLYDGDSIIQSKDLTIGLNDITFDHLSYNTLYQYAIISKFDQLDGLNASVKILTKKAIYTPHIIQLANTQVTHSSIAFDVVLLDDDYVGNVSVIEIYKEDALLSSVMAVSHETMTGLLSNSVYTIKVKYDYNLNDGQGLQSLWLTQDITTLSKPKPIIQVDNIKPTQDSFSFDITLTNIDDTGQITNIELLKDDVFVTQLSDLSVLEFTNLKSNNEYTLKITCTYDPNEGNGLSTVVKTVSVKTLSKSEPMVILNHLIPTANSIEFDLDFIDIDSVGSITAIQLYSDNQFIQTLPDLSTNVFTNLSPDTPYEIRVTYQYDLCDGTGMKSNTTTIDKYLNNIASLNKGDFTIKGTNLETGDIPAEMNGFEAILNHNNSSTTINAAVIESYHFVQGKDYVIQFEIKDTLVTNATLSTWSAFPTDFNIILQNFSLSDEFTKIETTFTWVAATQTAEVHIIYLSYGIDSTTHLKNVVIAENLDIMTLKQNRIQYMESESYQLHNLIIVKTSSLMW